jgi:holo-[acyl-carrier-protein] synthase
MGNGISTGIDIVSIGRIERANASERFLSRLFTHSEIEYAKASVVPHRLYATFFAAKEAAGKALGTGLGRGFGFRDIEVVFSECVVRSDAPSDSSFGLLSDDLSSDALSNDFPNNVAGSRGHAPTLKFHNGAARLLGVRRTFLSVSASGDVAVAKVLIE